MKKINDMWEDAAANSVSGGGVALPADAVNKKKKKKAVYDGRTKEGRKFVERMLANRKARMERQTVTASKQNLASITVKEEPVAEAASSKVHVPGENFSVVPKVRRAKLYWRIEDDRGYLFDEVPVGTLGLKLFKKMYGIGEETVDDLVKGRIKEAVGDTTVEDGVNAYVTAVNAEMMKGEFSKQYEAKQEELKARAANKYWRLEIFEFGKARSIHAFVDKETGDIYKPAGWKAPAKGSRGNITDPSYISRVSQTRHPQMGGHLYKTARGGRGR
jgi:hypothetical protein